MVFKNPFLDIKPRRRQTAPFILCRFPHEKVSEIGIFEDHSHSDNEFGPGIYATNDFGEGSKYAQPQGAVMVFFDDIGIIVGVRYFQIPFLDIKPRRRQTVPFILCRTSAKDPNMPSRKELSWSSKILISETFSCGNLQRMNGTHEKVSEIRIFEDHDSSLRLGIFGSFAEVIGGVNPPFRVGTCKG
jgi:hypothetical protein